MNQEAILIRAGRDGDAAALAAFGARTFAETFGADNRPDDLQAHLSNAFGLQQQTHELLDPNMITLLAYRGEVLVAFAQVQRKDPPPCVAAPRPIELHRFYVDRPAHGKGIAQQLMRAVHDAARSFGCHASLAWGVGAKPAGDRVLQKSRIHGLRQHRVPRGSGSANRSGHDRAGLAGPERRAPELSSSKAKLRRR